MRQHPQHSTRCRMSDRCGGLEASKTDQLCIYRCHAGLTDFSIPLVIAGHLVGFVLCGQVRLSNDVELVDILNVDDRWVGVDWLTMQATAASDIHVLGDATFSAPGMPKSGHMANQHAKVAAAAIIQLLKGEPVNATPVMNNTCYSFVSGSEAMHVASVHQYDAAEKTLKTVPGSGGVSAASSALEGRYALSWAQNIWADSLAL